MHSELRNSSSVIICVIPDSRSLSHSSLNDPPSLNFDPFFRPSPPSSSHILTFTFIPIFIPIFIPLPITTPRKQLRQPLQPNPINLIKSILFSTIHINNRHQLLFFFPPFLIPLDNDGHDDLALTIPITRNVARECVNVGHELGLARGGGGAADAAAKGNLLAGDFAHKGA
ncbi:hypothetical protein CFIO01_09852 [Colletotrichum fioriniae PJ7]|uniref:Uncharacterized protein n=1 Tax=Colletotrichum fioriniae PJ7 TaxID=1445577 RepID=A0A010SD61_9PEZI|nr:hypothetical protein CFIO01_09852 [Colletotrichum fioriniae PJ7]